jgi:hypothetical protein
VKAGTGDYAPTSEAVAAGMYMAFALATGLMLAAHGIVWVSRNLSKNRE